MQTAISLGGTLVLGAGIGLISGVLGAEFMKSVEEAYLARCGAIFNAISCAAMPVVSAVIGLAAVFCSVSWIFVACGLLCVVLFIWIKVTNMQFESPAA